MANSLKRKVGYEEEDIELDLQVERRLSSQLYEKVPKICIDDIVQNNKCTTCQRAQLPQPSSAARLLLNAMRLAVDPRSPQPTDPGRSMSIRRVNPQPRPSGHERRRAETILGAYSKRAVGRRRGEQWRLGEGEYIVTYLESGLLALKERYVTTPYNRDFDPPISRYTYTSFRPYANTKCNKRTCFPISAELNSCTPHSAQEEHLMPDLLLGSVALLRHVSSWDESRNQDPEVLLNLETTYSSMEKVPSSNGHLGQVIPLKRKQETSAGGHGFETETDDVSRKKIKTETRNQRRRNHKLKDPMRKTEELQSEGGIDAMNLKISKTGWQGVDFKQTDKGKAVVRDWQTGQVGKHLLSFKRIHYREHFKTRIRDAQGRKIIVRTFVGEPEMVLANTFPEEVKAFVDAVEAAGTGFSEADMEANARGAHFFSIMGHDRQCKEKPGLSKFHRDNQELINNLMAPGTATSKLNYWVNLVNLWQNILNGNSPESQPGIANVQNGWAFTLCLDPSSTGASMPLVKKLNGYIVSLMWTPKTLPLESAFYGFMFSSVYLREIQQQNPVLVDIEKHIVVTNNGEYPTPDNSVPLNDGTGRGSAVWFNQASMFQTAELGVSTIAEAKRFGMDATCDAKGLIDNGLFPYNN
ncbi:hypothetical protein F5887DRAFT_921052 [Amanita rubescens]|nr:hypothetical protein F5887DRAFT_921052 [Amanita rubescens]